jgi:hypothetical protein
MAFAPTHKARLPLAPISRQAKDFDAAVFIFITACMLARSLFDCLPLRFYTQDFSYAWQLR